MAQQAECGKRSKDKDKVKRNAPDYADSWLNQQVQYDLWIAEQNAEGIDVEQLSAA